MDILGIGPLEIVFILILALIIFGPNDIVKAGKTVGSFLRKIVMSDGWKAFQEAQKGLRNLPNTLMREAGLEEKELKRMTGMSDLRDVTKEFENQIAPWTTPPPKFPKPPEISGASAPAETPPETEDAKSAATPSESPTPETHNEE